MAKRKFDNTVINEEMEVSSLNNKNKAVATEKSMDYKVSSSSNTIYSSRSIKSLLKTCLPNANIEDVYLFKGTGDHVYFNCIKKLKTKLIHETKDKIVSNEKFYVIIEQSSNSDLQVSSATILKLYNKNNDNQIIILPVLASTSCLLMDELQNESELSKVSLESDSEPKWLCENQSISIYLDNLIEIIKLSIVHKLPSKIPYDKIKEIMHTPYAEYETSHQELLNTLKSTDDEEIYNLILSDKEQGEVKASSRIKKTVSWDFMVEDNEGRTIRKKKKKKKKEEEKKENKTEEYFKQCIASWDWDKEIWYDEYFNTNKLNTDQFKELISKHCDEIVNRIGYQVLHKRHYDDCDDINCDHIQLCKSLDKIIEGYVFLIIHFPNLLAILKENEKLAFIALSRINDVFGFYSDHPELKLSSIIEKRIVTKI